MGLFMSGVLTVFLSSSLMFIFTFLGFFNNVALDIGLEHYAETKWIPMVDVMPLNSLINFGYIAVGLYWCYFTETAYSHGVLKGYDVELFYTFNLLASVYGFIQMARIVTQQVIWAVLDQWFTLPIFAMVLVWGMCYQYGWSTRRCYTIILLSIFSYVLTLFSSIGFEISLGCHVLGALYGAILAYRKHPTNESLFSFCAALIMCGGFVVLKLLDLRLPSLSFIFRYCSGHFLSKICDVYQIHFVNAFFFDIALQKAVDLSVEDKRKWVLKDEKRRKETGNDPRNPVMLSKRKKL